MSVLAIRAPLAWLGPGRLVEDALIVLEDDRVAFAGAASELSVVTVGEEGPHSLSGRLVPPEPDEEILFGGFVMPGVADRHVHIGLSDPGAVVAGGVTAVRDLAWPPEDILPLAHASEGPSFNGPLIRAAGAMITARGGYPTRSGWAPEGTGVEVQGPAEAAAAAANLLDRGAALIKVALNSEAGPTLSDEELVAVCDAAHERGSIVTAHAQGRGQAARALGAGVDEFAHCPWSERLTDDQIGAMAKAMRVISTLDIHSYGRDTPDLRTAVENLSRFVEAGGRVSYGTDLGNGSIPPGIHVGEAWHLRRSGLIPERILEAMMFRPLADGEPGDLVGLGGNPLEDLDALADVRLVVAGGRRLR